MKARIFLALAFVLASFLCCSPAGAAGEGAELHTLSVEGRGTAEAAPDQATAIIGVATHGKDAAAAQSDNAARVQSIIEALRGLGIEAKDIQTNRYSFRPTYRHAENRESEIDGYAVDNAVSVKINDVGMTGKVIDAALRHGANQIHSLEFHVRDTRKLRQQALQAAIRDAKEKADIIASSLGCRIAGVHHVSESTGDFAPRQFNALMMSKAAGDGVPVESGTISLDARVSIDFILGN